MNRRALILDELGLSPVWIRPAQLVQLQKLAPAELPSDSAMQTQPVNDPHFTPIANAAHHQIEVQIQQSETKAPSEKAAAARQLLQQNRSASSNPNTVAKATTDDPEIQARNTRISSLNWEELRAEVSACTACPRSEKRQQAVFGTGAIDAKLMIVTEAPSIDEERANLACQGMPLKMFNQMLISLGGNHRHSLFTTNVVKCHTTRNPTSAEIAACAPLLQRQIALIQPKAILATGQFAAESVLSTAAPIRELRGTSQHCQNIPTVVSYHPNYLQRNVHDKAKAWQDLLQLKAALES